MLGSLPVRQLISGGKPTAKANVEPQEQKYSVKESLKPEAAYGHAG